MTRIRLKLESTVILNFLRWFFPDTNQNEEATRKSKISAKLAVDRDNLFSRIEESRMALEDELGMDLFIKVYRHVQVRLEAFFYFLLGINSPFNIFLLQ